MNNKFKYTSHKINRRQYGLHLTSSDVFWQYVFPHIKNKLYEHIWVDFFAGEGNLILPILEIIPEEERTKFFEKQIFLFDLQPEMVQRCIEKAIKYKIPREIAQKNIRIRNNLESSPSFLKEKKLPIYHITNPPYLYLGYIKKHKETHNYLQYFEHTNEGYQDLYQIAMINDLRSEIENLIYLIPSNFLFGASVSNKFRLEFLKYYNIVKMIIFEKKIFDFTGTNICIGFFKRKVKPKTGILQFSGIKIKKKNRVVNKKYVLKPEFKFRAGSEFNEFLEKYRVKNPLNVRYYLLKKLVFENQGNYETYVIDANRYENNRYKEIKLRVNKGLRKKLESNILYVRTVDTGSNKGRVGLGIIKDDFNVQGIYVSGNTYRTHPIQIFFEPQISTDDQILLKNYFNLMLEYFRKELDSEFLTTYKYSNAEYTRKYLGLTQTRKLIETLPILELDEKDKKKLNNFIQEANFEELLKIIYLHTQK